MPSLEHESLAALFRNRPSLAGELLRDVLGIAMVLPDAPARELEDMMASGTYPYKSDLARRHFARGEAEGEARGEARGEAKGEAKAILRVLSARGLCVPEEVRDRVIGCTDIARLERWLDRAVVATSVDDVFSDG